MVIKINNFNYRYIFSYVCKLRILKIKINVERINNIKIGRYTNCIPMILAVYPKIGGAIMKLPYTAIVITVIPTVGLIFLIEEANV